MQIEGGKEGLLSVIVNKQFEMIGEKMRFEKLPQDGLIEVGGKRVKWFDHYKFSEEQEEEWRKWAFKQVEVLGDDVGRKVMMHAELRYGFVIRYKKEGELF